MQFPRGLLVPETSKGSDAVSWKSWPRKMFVYFNIAPQFSVGIPVYNGIIC